MYVHVYKINVFKKTEKEKCILFFQPFCCDSALIVNDVKHPHSLMESFSDHRQKSATAIYLLSFVINYIRK